MPQNTININNKKMLDCLITSLEDPSDKNTEQEWIKLAEERLSALEKTPANSITWDSIKKKFNK